MRAEHGTLMMVASRSPEREQISEIAIDSHIMELKRLTNASAVIWGSESIDISSITPTSRMVRTMHTATRTVMAVDMNVTGRWDPGEVGIERTYHYLPVAKGHEYDQHGSE